MLQQLIPTVSTLDKIYGLWKNLNDGSTLNDVLDKEKRDVFYAKGNVLSLIGDLIVEPKILVTEDLRHHPELFEILNANLDVFVATYTQAFNKLTKIHGLDSSTTISLLSSSLKSSNGFESVAKVLKTPESKWAIPQQGTEKSAEYGDTVQRFFKKIKFETSAKNDKGEPLKSVIEILVKPAVIYVPSSDIIKLIKSNGDDKSLSANYHAYKSGEKSLADAAFGTTLVKNYKKALLADENSTLTDVEEAKKVAYSKLATDGAIGFGLMHQLIIVPSSMITTINTLVRGKISKDKYKDKLLNQINSMMLTTVDDDFEAISLYMNSIKGTMDIPFNKLKSSGSKSSELTDLFKLISTSKGI